MTLSDLVIAIAEGLTRITFGVWANAVLLCVVIFYLHRISNRI